jgi:para-nitrobenzyl esterase
MGHSAWLGLAASLAAAAVPAAASENGTSQVRTSLGTLEGASDGQVDRFLGIRFAAPPTGPLRWRAPQPAASWQGVRAAKAFGSSCPQALEAPTQLAPLGPTSEDCLFLNIWRPSDARHKSLPVLVWIHGGGFIAGSGSEAVFDGTPYAERDVILVTINYRLGRLGIFAHPALNLGHEEEPSGNYGYLDQIAALRWVQAHIAGFGGDPRNVTIAGESAGGVSVLALAASPMTEGLFHKAIVQSGAGLEPARSIDIDAPGRASAMSAGRRYAMRNGIKGEDGAAAAALRALPVETLAPSAPSIMEIMGIFAEGGPMIDGKVVTAAPGTLLREGKGPAVPFLIGNTSMETAVWSFDATGPGLLPLGGPFTAEGLLPAATPEEREALVGRYLEAAMGDRPTALAMLASALQWGMASRGLAAAASRRAPTYLYRLEAVPTPARSVTAGSPHGTDIFYMFSALDRFRARPDLVTDEDRKMAALMTDYWAGFARSGVPTSPAGPAWPAYTPDGDLTLVIGNEGAAAVRLSDVGALAKVPPAVTR